MKRLLALMLCLVMLVSAVPTQAIAAEGKTTSISDSVGATPKEGKIYSVNDKVVNGLYAGLFKPEDIPDGEAPEFVDPNISAFAATSDSGYVSQSTAESQLRSAFVSRKSSVTLLVKFKGSKTSTQVVNASKSIVNSALKHTGKPKEGDYLMFQFAYYDMNGKMQYSGGYTYVTYNFDVEYYSTAAQESEVNTKVSQIVSSLGLSGKSPLRKAELIYNYIVNHVDYDYAHLSANDRKYYTLQYTAYNALQGSAVCQGYAVLFYRLALEAGLNCRVVVSSKMDHAWNIVKMPDGKYYYLDATWDENINNLSFNQYVFFLKGTSEWDSNHTTGNGVSSRGGVATGVGTTKTASSAYTIPTYNYLHKTSITTIKNGTSGIYLEWTAMTFANSYNIYRSVAGGEYEKIATVTGTTYTDKEAPAGKLSTYKISCNAEDFEYPTAKSSGKSFCRISKPVITVAKKSGSKIVVDWDTAEGAYKYYVYRSVNGGSFKKVATVKDTRYVDKSTTKGKKYAYRIYGVRTVNGVTYKGKYAATSKIKR